MFEQMRVGFIGGGNMGEALIRGLLAASLLRPAQVKVCEMIRPRMEYLQETYGIVPCSAIAELAIGSDVVFLCVKPQSMSSVLRELNPCLSHRPLIITIAAGISLETVLKALPDGMPVIRVMPNTPALVLEAASALARSSSVTDDQMKLALAFFQAIGTAVEVEERWMDTVTGLSGSGPAYVLLLLESFMDAGVLMGLPRPVARDLVLQTVAGTVKMVREMPKHPAELKDMVTSPGGTTIRGLAILEEQGVRGAILRAVEAATLRSRELGKG